MTDLPAAAPYDPANFVPNVSRRRLWLGALLPFGVAIVSLWWAVDAVRGSSARPWVFTVILVLIACYALYMIYSGVAESRGVKSLPLMIEPADRVLAYCAGTKSSCRREFRYQIVVATDYGLVAYTPYVLKPPSVRAKVGYSQVGAVEGIWNSRHRYTDGFSITGADQTIDLRRGNWIQIDRLLKVVQEESGLAASRRSLV